MSNIPIKTLPAKFGSYGGAFVPEVLMPALIELEQIYIQAKADVLVNLHVQDKHQYNCECSCGAR